MLAISALAIASIVDSPQAAAVPLTRVVAGAVPSSLDSVESAAEDIVDSALGRDRAAMVRQSAELTTAVRGDAASTLARAGVPRPRIQLLRSRAAAVARRARSGSFIAAALSANAVSALMPEFYARFAGQATGAVLRLDYLDREAQLRSLAGNRARLPSIAAELASSWKSVRPRILAKGGTTEAHAFDHHVAALRRLAPGPPKALQAEAARGLELVDELEGVLAR